ncbi:MAG: hypothetical protein US71_C0018G0007 [Parcubacteria group bacterium GW2011_GWD2_38_12]|nr:MAG: hypothetical protein US06_C0018G0003 [Parcubacteria group bacterium GW2011_GWC2_36_17]KKQ40548.1 MAG: hypothetical protein US56_C0002G0010 [Candidatus Moranbacteria bacterium GW2011_GWF2_37_7]KKQ43333.1 MAG: hypothetical protein US61_C0012G0007 [Parcubacteria group bacterium GW2011_GWE2_37_8]KKQ51052.1 MAG: hypothetical protein US71_C0018G0007 [Parcubacteria group bacterium GW2011_GWD2_38_12]KKQ58152.1 MAG: hypothetical protein US79_C0012G0006 [Parcubacteria group bacterium GW2011_GWC1_
MSWEVKMTRKKKGNKNKMVTEKWIITVPENEIRNPVLNDVFKKFPELVVNLIEARVPPLIKGEQLSGVMTIEITGKESEIREAKYYLAERKIKIEFSIISDI